MTGNEYQQLALVPASKTNFDDLEAFIYAPEEVYDNQAAIIMATLGLTGEAGEVADLIKKAVFHKHGDMTALTAKIVAELGDVLWYVARLASAFGLNLEDIMQGNLDKLNARYEGGFSHAASINRVV